MTPIIVLVTITVYFILLLVVSAAAGRGSNNASFFTGNRQAPWPVVAFATMGAAISGVTFISVPGMVATKGYSYLQMALGFVVGYVAIAFVLVPLFYKRSYRLFTTMRLFRLSLNRGWRQVFPKP